jgi:DNA-binding beta-propeller fold protein YncE
MYRPEARAKVRGIVIGALTAATLTACASGGGQQAQPSSPAKPQQVFPAPKGLLAAAQPQPNGTLWALAGNAVSKGLFDISLATGKGAGSIPVSNAARSVTESLGGTVGLALGTGRTGALELLHGSTGKVIQTVPLGAPARDVVVGADGTTFYALNGGAASASVTVVNSRNGDVQGTVPVPLNTVSIAPDAQGSTVYALQPSGTVSQIAVAAGKIMTRFTTGPGGRSLALSPDGSTLYVLKDVTGSTENVAEVNLATESVQRVVPAPANCLQVLVSADGTQLYQLVGTPAYGNIQVFAS